MGSAAIQGPLWGAQARDWAEYSEQGSLPLFGAALDAARVTQGTRLLDAGCGAGLLALLARLRGATVTALDASAALLAVARARLPEADLREGDLEALPFAEASFDAVIAVNSIFYAADMAAAMRELARVVRPGGRVVLTAWGARERCETMTITFAALGPLMPPPAAECPDRGPGRSPRRGRWRGCSPPPGFALRRKARSPAPSPIRTLRRRGAGRLARA